MYLKCPNNYGIHMHVYPNMRQYIEHLSIYLLKHEDQQNVDLDLDPNCLTL